MHLGLCLFYHGIVLGLGEFGLILIFFIVCRLFWIFDCMRGIYGFSFNCMKLIFVFCVHVFGFLSLNI